MDCAECKFPSHQINSEGLASYYDLQQFALIGGVVALNSVEYLTQNERMLLLFSFALE